MKNNDRPLSAKKLKERDCQDGMQEARRLILKALEKIDKLGFALTSGPHSDVAEKAIEIEAPNLHCYYGAWLQPKDRPTP